MGDDQDQETDLAAEASLALTVEIVLSGARYIGKLASDERAAVVEAAVARGERRPRIAELLRFNSVEALAAWCRRHQVHLPPDPEGPETWWHRWLAEHRENARVARQRWRDDLGNGFTRQDMGKRRSRVRVDT